MLGHLGRVGTVGFRRSKGGAIYSLATDPRVLWWHEPDNGLTDKAFNSQYGALSTPGSVPTAVGLDGNLVWQVRAKTTAANFLHTATTPALPQPVHTFFITQSLNSPAANDTWLGMGGPRVAFGDATHGRALCSTVLASPACVPANYTLYESFFGGSQSRMSVNGSAYTAALPTGTGSSFVAGVSYGDYSGVNKTDQNVVFSFGYEGQMPDFARLILWAYLINKFPSLGLPSTMPTAFLNTVSDASHLLVSPFYIIPVVLSQSNGTAMATVATIAPSAGILMLGEDNTVKPLVSAFCSITNQVDMVAGNATQHIGSWIGRFANLCAAATTKQIVIVPCALGGSYMHGPNPAVSYAVWDPAYPRNNKQRNSLFWSAVYRIQQLQALGGTVPFAVTAQGEAEAASAVSTSDPLYTQWPAQFTSAADQFFAAISTTKRIVYSRNCVTVPAGTAGQWSNFRLNQQPAAQSAAQLMIDVGTTTEFDLTHWDQVNCDTVAGPAYAAAAIGAGWLP